MQANGKVNQQGAIADYLEVQAGYERAVEACLGDLLEHVVVERPEHAAAGFQLIREAAAGRCGFLVTERSRSTGARRRIPRLDERHRRRVLHAAPRDIARPSLPDGVVALSSVVRVTGPFADAVRQAVGEAGIATSYEGAASASR